MMRAVINFGPPVIWAGLAVCVLSSPLAQLAQQGTFSLQEIAVPVSQPLTGLDLVQETYIKYGLEVPSELKRVSSVVDPKGSTGTVAATSYGTDMSYLVKVQIGKQNMTMDLDTGSSDL
jgi:hypothetical protein